MSTTSAYGWNIPDNTDLVKDGALAIRTLGNAIDTSMNTALGTKKAGMVLLNTTSFSGVTAQSVANDTFTSTYTNYKILINITSVALDTNLTFKFRKAGTDNSTAYYFQWVGLAGGAANNFGSNNQTSAFLNGLDAASSANFYGVALDVFSPQVNIKTTVAGTFMGLTQAGAAWGGAGGFWHDVVDSYDAFTIIAGGNISGTIQVFGYNK